MHINNHFEKLSEQIAAVADLCLKPWKHSVIIRMDNDSNKTKLDDLTLAIHARDIEGLRSIENDLEVEIYKSGSDMSITLSRSELLNCPILWHGTYSLWMDSETGRSCKAPIDSTKYETFVRRLRSLLLE